MTEPLSPSESQSPQVPGPTEAEREATAKFLEEMERRRAASAPPPAPVITPTHSRYVARIQPSKPEEGGLASLAIRLGIASNAQQANTVLILVLVVVVALIIWLNLPSSGPSSAPPPPLPGTFMQGGAPSARPQ